MDAMNAKVWGKRVAWGLLAVVVYLASIPPVLVGLYWVKTAAGIDTVYHGGWHHFNACLMREMDIEKTNLQNGHYGALTPFVPLLAAVGVMEVPAEGGETER